MPENNEPIENNPIAEQVRDEETGLYYWVCSGDGGYSCSGWTGEKWQEEREAWDDFRVNHAVHHRAPQNGGTLIIGSEIPRPELDAVREAISTFQENFRRALESIQPTFEAAMQSIADAYKHLQTIGLIDARGNVKKPSDRPAWQSTYGPAKRKR